MILSSQTIDFIQFIIVGNVLALIFDIFRAYRKYKKSTKKFVVVQDVLFFIIALAIIIYSIISFLDDSLRFYLFIAIFLGIIIYLGVFSKTMIRLYIKFFTIYHHFVLFLLLPIQMVWQFSVKIYKFFEKIVKKTCKIIKNMLCYLYHKLKNATIVKFKLQKRVKNEKPKKDKKKKTKQPKAKD